MAEIELSFIQATPEHHARVLAILQDRARWLASSGSKQWGVFLSDRADAFVADLIATGYTHLVTSEGRDVGTLRLQWSDRMFWGDDGVDGKAGYVHTLAVHRDFAARKIGARMLDWACEQIAANGRSLLRIDCGANNAKLIAYYLSLGFEKRGIVAVNVEPDYRAQQLERSVRLPLL